MGSVYLARDGVLQREVAVKSIKPAPGNLGQEFSARFLNEARCVASLKHPNIVPVFDLGLEGETPYIVMEVVDGPALGDAIKDGQVSVRKARTIGIQIANALAEAHRAGIVHRDVKPANILQSGDDNWKLVDFGVAHVPDSSLTTVGDFLGTPAYSAPESLEGEGFSAASDVYGLAATLYAVLTGGPPYGLGNAVQIALRASEKAAPSLGAVAPTTPSDLVQTIDLCLSRDPAHRPSAAELAAQLASARPETADPSTPVPFDPSTPAPAQQASVAMHSSSAQRQTSAGGRKWLLPSLAVVVLGAGIAFAVTGGGGNGQGDNGEGSSQVSGFATAANGVTESAKPVDNPADRENAAKASSRSGTQAPSRTSPAKSGLVPVGKPEQAFDGLTDVHQLMARKKVREATRSLDRLRRKNPDSAYLAYLQGTLHMQRSFWKDGFTAYRSAIAKDARYREHPQVIRDGVQGLSSRSKPGLAIRFLRDTVGAAAIPELERSLQTTSNPQIKSRIKSLLKKLN